MINVTIMKGNIMANYTFIKYTSLYDSDLVLYGLEKDPLTKFIDGIKFIEVTPDFKRVQFVRLDSLKPTGSIVKQY